MPDSTEAVVPVPATDDHLMTGAGKAAGSGSEWAGNRDLRSCNHSVMRACGSLLRET